MNQTLLRTIFESSGSPRRINLPQEYTLIEGYLQRNILALTKQSLQEVPHGFQYRLTQFLAMNRQHLWEIELPSAIPPLATIDNGGGLAHQKLCWLAAAWLLDQGFSVIAEQRFAGKRVDLITRCRHWVIECGDTAPSPIVRHFLKGATLVGVVPFQDVSPQEDTSAYVFSKGVAWSSTTVQKDLIIRLEGDI